MEDIDRLNPRILLSNHIGPGNMPVGVTTFGERITRWHELDVILWGSGCDHVTGKDYPVTQGDVFYRTPGLVNRHDLPYHCYFFVFDPFFEESHEALYRSDPLNGVTVSRGFEPMPLFSFAKGPYLGKAMDLEALVRLCRSIMVEYSGASPDRLTLKILFLQLLREVSAQFSKPAETALSPYYQQYWQGIQEVMNRIRENPTERVSMQDMAGRLHVSYSFFSRVFKAVAGENFSSYVMRIRLNCVKVMLTDTNKSIAGIASECGFSDPDYLYIMFRREIGCTPGEYRVRTAYGEFSPRS